MKILFILLPVVYLAGNGYLFEQSHGYRKWSRSHIFVSSGLSLWGPPFRIGTHSDMALIEVK